MPEGGRTTGGARQTARMEASWTANADRWVDAVREQRIESRRLATDRAVLEAVLSRGPRVVLDLGCGEGWLVRALTEAGVEAVGVDGSGPLVAAAHRLGGGAFHRISYDGLIADPHAAGTGFDAAVANFALLQEDVGPLLTTVRRTLTPGGRLVIQTVHPWAGSDDAPYVDGWRTEHFSAFGPAEAWQPMPWYFRTLESWAEVLESHQYRIERLREPRHPETGAPLSLLIECVSSAGTIGAAPALRPRTP